MTEETEVVVMMDGAEFSLADLAGVDLSTVEAYRIAALPVGKYHWRVIEAELGHAEVPLDYDDPNSEKVNRPEIKFTLEVQNCLALVDDKLDPADFVSRKQFVSFKIKDMKKDLGKVVAFLEDIRSEGTGTVIDQINAAHGHEFVSDLQHGKNANNPDYPFINLKNHQSIEEFNASVNTNG